jgi:Fe-S-cluster containining protein
LEPDDLARLTAQGWDQRPEFAAQPWKVKVGWLSKQFRLAQRADSSCVFLMPDGKCQIHAEFGFEAKPLLCKVYPLQIVPLGNKVVVTTRRSCPSAAADLGTPLADQRRELELRLAEQVELARHAKPPNILPGLARNWNDTLRVAELVERAVADERFPMVRRLAQLGEFWDLFESCSRRKLAQLDGPKLAEVCQVLLEEAMLRSGVYFSDRQPPDATAAVFRQTASETVRLHPLAREGFQNQSRWGLAKIAIRFARGKGELPDLIDGFAKATFAQLEEPLGKLSPELLEPLDRYIVTFTQTLRYAQLGYLGWSMADGFRALALQYPLALWLVRWMGEPRNPERLYRVLTALDRAHGYAPLTSARQRRRVRLLTRGGRLSRLLAWYAR